MNGKKARKLRKQANVLLEESVTPDTWTLYVHDYSVLPDNYKVQPKGYDSIDMLSDRLLLPEYRYKNGAGETLRLVSSCGRHIYGLLKRQYKLRTLIHN